MPFTTEQCRRRSTHRPIPYQFINSLHHTSMFTQPTTIDYNFPLLDPLALSIIHFPYFQFPFRETVSSSSSSSLATPIPPLERKKEREMEQAHLYFPFCISVIHTYLGYHCVKPTLLISYQARKENVNETFHTSSRDLLGLAPSLVTKMLRGWQVIIV